MLLPIDLQTELLKIKDVQRNYLNSDQIKLYKAAYHYITKKVPPTGCSQLCTTVYLLVRNAIKKIEAVEPIPSTTEKAEVEVKRVAPSPSLGPSPTAAPSPSTAPQPKDIEHLSTKQLKALASKMGIKYARNATKKKMIELITSTK